MTPYRDESEGNRHGERTSKKTQVRVKEGNVATMDDVPPNLGKVAVPSNGA